MALSGGGAWAVVFQQLAASLTATSLVWRFSSWRPSLTYSVASLRSLAGFTANVFGTGILMQLRLTIQTILIGRFLGAPALGAYTLAYNIILVPFNRVAVPLAQVLFPALSSVQDDRGRIIDYWLRSLRLIAAVAVPSALGMVVLAPDFVDVVLGDEWSASTRVIQLLAIVGLLQTLQFMNPVVLQAIDRTDLLLRWTALSYAASLAGLLIGLKWGIVGVAAALAIAAAIVEPGFALVTARAVGLRFSVLARCVSGVAQASLVMVGVVVLARHGAIALGIGPGIRLPALVLIGAAAFVPACAWRAPEVRSELAGLARHRRRNDRDHAPALPTATSRGEI